MKRINSYFYYEWKLLIISTLTPLLFFYLIFVDTSWSKDFIELQLKSVTLFTICSFGISTVLTSRPLGSSNGLNVSVISLPLLIFFIPGIFLIFTGNHDFYPIFFIASTFYISSLYRITKEIFKSKFILLMQFLPLLEKIGIIFLIILIVVSLINLYMKGVFKKTSEKQILPYKLFGAWAVSSTKDIFYRGHYIILSFFNIASQDYAVILKFLDLLSRPSDYIFQRLVDLNFLQNRFRQVLLFTPIVALTSGFMGFLFLDRILNDILDVTLFLFFSVLIFISKYLAFNLNFSMKYLNLSIIYLLSMIFASPFIFLFASENSIPLLPVASGLIFSVILLLKEYNKLIK